MSQKRFLVKWIEHHEAIIEAKNEDEAWELSEFEDEGTTKTATVHQSTECLGEIDLSEDYAYDSDPRNENR